MNFRYYLAFVFLFLQQASNQAAISKHEISLDSLPVDFGQEVVCRDGLWMCPNSTRCIVAVWRCDGRLDCANGEDELDCSKSDKEVLFIYEILKNDTPDEEEYEYIWETRRKTAASGLARMNQMELEMLSQMTQEYYNELYRNQWAKLFLAFITPIFCMCCIIGILKAANKKLAALIK